jgi:hypothetical protein
MKSLTPKEYLDSLLSDRKEAVKTIRNIILENLPSGYEEVIAYGMLTYVVPLSIYPKGYLNKKDTPLPYISLASQKNHMALYFMHLYGDPKALKWFQDEYKRAGKKLDMGKSCVRFKKLEDLPLDVIGKAVALMSVKKYIEMYESARIGKPI